jgi:MFS family permease
VSRPDVRAPSAPEPSGPETSGPEANAPPDPEAGGAVLTENAPSLGARLRRHAVDTRPLQYPIYRRLLIGQGAAFIGAMITQVAVPVQVYRISHSSLLVGMVGLAGLVPIVVFGLYGGAIADAVDRRKLYLVSSLGVWAVTIGLLLQTLAGVASAGLILALVFIQSAFFAISSSARGAIIPRIVALDIVPAANTLSFTVSSLGAVVGPLIAGVLVGVRHGFGYAYASDAVLFTVALYSVFRLPSIRPDRSDGGNRLGLRSVVEGLRFISGQPVLFMSFLVDIAAMVLAMPRALYPQVADERFGGAVGPLYAAIAIGSVLAGLFSGWIGRLRRQGVALTLAVASWGAAVAISGLAHQLWLVVVLLALAGAADLVSSVYRQTILQTYAPDAMRGRMQGVFIAVVAGGPRLGDLRAGATAAATTATISWTGGGIACVVVVLLAAVLVKPFWRYDATTVLAARTSATQA